MEDLAEAEEQVRKRIQGVVVRGQRLPLGKRGRGRGEWDEGEEVRGVER